MKSPEQSGQLWLGGRRRGTPHLSSLWGRRGEPGSLVAGQVSQLRVSQPGLSLTTAGPAAGAVSWSGWLCQVILVSSFGVGEK